MTLDEFKKTLIIEEADLDYLLARGGIYSKCAAMIINRTLAQTPKDKWPLWCSDVRRHVLHRCDPNNRKWIKCDAEPGGNLMKFLNSLLLDSPMMKMAMARKYEATDRTHPPLIMFSLKANGPTDSECIKTLNLILRNITMDKAMDKDIAEEKEEVVVAKASKGKEEGNPNVDEEDDESEYESDSD